MWNDFVSDERFVYSYLNQINRTAECIGADDGCYALSMAIGYGVSHDVVSERH